MSIAAHNPPHGACDDLIEQVESLRHNIRRRAERGAGQLVELPPERQTSAANLLHYLALRSRDLRPLQDRLYQLGLSSLGRSEPHVLATLDMVLCNLYLLNGEQPPENCIAETGAGFGMAADLLERNTEKLFGPPPDKRRVHIMVTMPTEAADDYMTVHQLLLDGMNCMRINCSKDDANAWARMIRHLQHACRATGRNCKVLMDLGGPKLRTGPMKETPGILKIRPRRAADGSVTRPARIWLTPAGSQVDDILGADAVLHVDAEWLSRITPEDRIRLRDTRNAKRTWNIREIGPNGCWAEAGKTTYVANGTVLRLKGERTGRATEITTIPPGSSRIRLRKGDVLWLRENGVGKPALLGDDGAQLTAGEAALPIPEVYRDARPGEPVFFDDGRIGGIIDKVDGGRLQIRITHTHKPVESLQADRGINFPDTQLDLPALSEKDLADLEFAARHADMIGLSFTNSAGDVAALREKLAELGREEVGVVVKIETKRGFANLPSILLEALKFRACGVMIARGDLAVECGFERMAELQQEIMWVCESAHVPVIWATQVLENLTRRGFASRAEITDAAMGQSAEAVMLNKGPHIFEAVRTLDDILQRMQGHHSKKRSMLRELRLASSFNKL